MVTVLILALTRRPGCKLVRLQSWEASAKVLARVTGFTERRTTRPEPFTSSTRQVMVWPAFSSGEEEERLVDIRAGTKISIR